MEIADFHLERYFARWEFAAPFNLCASDIEGVPMADLLALADDDCSALWQALALGYTEAPGHPLLRGEIATLYRGLGPEHVYTFAGAEEAIFVLMHALLRPGDHVVAVWPTYQALYEVARSIGAEVTLLELREQEGWQLDLDVYRDALRPGATRLVVTNWPHSPTGTMPPGSVFDEAARLAGEAGARFLSDEVYRFLEHDPADRLPAGAECGPHGVSLGVMSKAFGLAGLRIGWLATRDEDLLARCARIKDYTTICNSAPSEVLALVGLRARDALLERALGLVRPNRDRVGAFLSYGNGLSWVRPSAGSVGYVRLPQDVSATRFCDDLVREEGVLLLPSTVFEHDDRHVRIGLGRSGMDESLERLGRFLGGRS
jgi:aspartate/methionine/tyrosine aminotransferase